MRSIAKLEAELGETILYVPRQVFQSLSESTATMTIYRNNPIKTNVEFTSASSIQIKPEKTLAYVS